MDWLTVILAQDAITETVAEGDFLSNLSTPMQIAILLGALSFITAIVVSVTAFTRIIIVLSFVRRALSTQEIPPNPVLLSLSFFLTLFVMAPTFEAIHENALVPLWEQQEADRVAEEMKETGEDTLAVSTLDAEVNASEKFGYKQAWEITSTELKKFMMEHTRIDDLGLFFRLSETEVPYDELNTPLTILIPAFIVSELKTAFIMGFCIYIPFLLIDIVVSTILMSLGMMMMPPVVVSTPCKILLFVMVDGWQLIIRALISSFAGG